MATLELSFESGEDSLSVRRFAAREQMSSTFEVDVWAVSPSDDLDLDALVGRPARFTVATGMIHAHELGRRRWVGVCSFAEQVEAEATGLSTYHVKIVPALWLLGQRRNYRIFQHLAAPEIVAKLLGEWGVAHALRVDPGEHPKLEYRVQYGESDYAFACRLLEEAGIAFSFDASGAVILSDQPHADEPRPGGPIPFVDNPNQAAEREFVTRVRVAHEVRPGRVTIRDVDFRRQPDFPLVGEASAPTPEARFEHYVYRPGAFVVEGGRGGDSPVADDRCVARADERMGKVMAERSLAAARASRRRVAFRTNALDLAPGSVFAMGGHPRSDLAPARRLLVTELAVEGAVGEEWTTEGKAVSADAPYRPPQTTPKPTIAGVQPAVVVGPPGQEIHTDEFGRVRVQFPWDREGKSDDESSCWLRVAHASAGGGSGMIQIPRVGQEVLIGFVDGNPDQPIVVGRVFSNTSPVPYKLPEGKTVTAWKSITSPGGGGYNEIKFDDAAGSELVSVRAQRDMRKHVELDETETTGANRSITVGADMRRHVEANETETTGANRSITVGADMNKHVKANETETTDGIRSIIVGAARSALVKMADSIVAGLMHKITVGPTAQTSQTMTHKKVAVTTGDATFTLDGADISLDANGAISIQAKGDITLEAKGKVTIKSSGDDVIVKGAPNVKVN